MHGEWLSLSEAADILGVHPSTVRSWADQGRLPVHRTHGGHRRFRRSEVDLCLKSQNSDGVEDIEHLAQMALMRTRMQISERHLEEEGWYQKLDDDARSQYRRSGRQLLIGLVNSMTTDQGDTGVEARALGYEYASRGQRYNLSCAEATRAFLFFRNLLVETLFNDYESSAIHSSVAYTNLFHQVTHFTDQILITLLETYEAYRKNSRS